MGWSTTKARTALSKTEGYEHVFGVKSTSRELEQAIRE